MKLNSLPRTVIGFDPAFTPSNADQRTGTRLDAWSGRATFVWFDEISGFDGAFGPRTEGKVKLRIYPSALMVMMVQLHSHTLVDGLLGPDTVSKFNDFFVLDEPKYTVAQLKEDLEVYETTGHPPDRIQRYARHLQREQFTHAVDDIERIAQEMKDLACGR